jgi:hypothetical protein
MAKIRNQGKKLRNPTPYYKYNPEDLTCRICNKIYDKKGYSSNKLGELAKRLIEYDGSGPRYRVVCKNCAPKENTHITCANCLINKPLSKYSKSQRSCNGNRRCISCIEKFIEEDVESSGAEYSDLDCNVAGNSYFDTSSHYLGLLNEQFSAMFIGSPTSDLITASTKSPAEFSPKEGFQQPKTSSKLALNTPISSLYQLIGKKDLATKSSTNSFNNASEISKTTIQSIECIKNDLDPFYEAIDQFPNLKDFFTSTKSVSEQSLDKRLNNRDQ